ncbi:MAG: CDP-alcohol phosphatidyltransferase family protein [Thermomicrobiales bacterium]|nr:CDP-alcohol phosphatidyltransferase family protein [Thermomicrobiales bacterium]
MANLITVGRLVLLFGVLAIIARAPVDLALLSMALIIVVFAGDGLDGWVARKRGSASQFGAVLDIAGDRIVETVLWVFFAYLRVIPLWVPLLVIVRGGIVDALRSLSYAEGMTAFGPSNMMRSDVTRWLTAGRFMRGLYGYAKAAGFVFLTGYVGFVHPATAGSWLETVYGQAWVRALGWGSVWLAIVLMMARGLPVIFDALPYLRNAPAPSSTGSEAKR